MWCLVNYLRDGYFFGDVSPRRSIAVRTPMLFIHRGADTVIPYEMTEELYRAKPGAKLLFTHDGGHMLVENKGGGGIVENREAFERNVDALLALAVKGLNEGPHLAGSDNRHDARDCDPGASLRAADAVRLTARDAGCPESRIPDDPGGHRRRPGRRDDQDPRWRLPADRATLDSRQEAVDRRSRSRRRDRTEIVGPIPGARDPVVDPNLARGVVNVIDSSVEMSHVLLRGFDAGLVGRQTDARRRGDPTSKFRNIAIQHMGRAILWKSRGKLDVSDSKITDVAWNGISLAPAGAAGRIGRLLKFSLASVIVSDFGNAGIVYIDNPGVCDDEHTVTNATLIGGGGPAILAIRSGVCVFDSHIAIPRVAGIVALSAGVLVQRTKIFFPLPTVDGRWGTGIVASAFGTGRSLVTVDDNEIKNVEHSFITTLGSDVVLTGNELVCRQHFDLVVGSHLGLDSMSPGIRRSAATSVRRSSAFRRLSSGSARQSRSPMHRPCLQCQLSRSAPVQHAAMNVGRRRLAVSLGSPQC
jgi:hypothetical protein